MTEKRTITTRKNELLSIHEGFTDDEVKFMEQYTDGLPPKSALLRELLKIKAINKSFKEFKRYKTMESHMPEWLQGQEGAVKVWEEYLKWQVVRKKEIANLNRQEDELRQKFDEELKKIQHAKRATMPKGDQRVQLLHEALSIRWEDLPASVQAEVARKTYDKSEEEQRQTRNAMVFQARLRRFLGAVEPEGTNQ